MGSGPGSFWFIYPRYDDLQTGQLIANHAHNDYLELWLEMRWLFAICAIPVLIAYFFQTWKIWRHGALYRVESTLLARVAGIGLFILLLHCMVDYPLRTTAISVIAAIFAAFMFLPETERFTEE
jgi:O-antigen ligase